MSHASDDDYVAPSEPEVREQLERWRGLKFGAIVHFAPGSQLLGHESWNLCSEDEDWIERTGPHADDYDAWKKAYERLPETYNPTRFDADEWAHAMVDAGMKYAVLPTKHHDGFCMWDSKTTDYKITAPQVPYASSPTPDIFGAMVKATRANNLGVGAYFSKPDWHTDDYWWRRFATPDRNVNYDPVKHPDRWERFKAFTRRQIEEITTSYGRIDILWLDGGWVRPHAIQTTLEAELVGRSLGHEQDIDLASIAAQVRRANPGTLVVDRTVHGPFENYLTPEQGIPESPLNSPWEACITLGNRWHSESDSVYKSANAVLRMLITTVARGGNLLLGIGPDMSGALVDPVKVELQKIGSWLRVNGEAIYDTVAAPVSEDDGVFFTASADRTALYALLPVEVFDEQGRASFTAPSTPAHPQVLGDATAGVRVDVTGDRVAVDLGGVADAPIVIRLRVS